MRSTSSSVHGLSLCLFVTSRCSIKTAKRGTRKERRAKVSSEDKLSVVILMWGTW